MSSQQHPSADQSNIANNSVVGSCRENAGNGKSTNSLPSYTAMIAQAILSGTSQRSALSEIYEFMERRFPPLKEKGNGWKNCVRHTLSLSDCFLKLHRPENGRSCHWAVHPTYLPRFLRGDFRKRRQSRVKRNTQEVSRDQYSYPQFRPVYERESTYGNAAFQMHVATAAGTSRELTDYQRHYHVPNCTNMMQPYAMPDQGYTYDQHHEQSYSYQQQYSKEYMPSKGIHPQHAPLQNNHYH